MPQNLYRLNLEYELKHQLHVFTVSRKTACYRRGGESPHHTTKIDAYITPIESELYKYLKHTSILKTVRTPIKFTCHIFTII